MFSFRLFLGHCTKWTTQWSWDSRRFLSSEKGAVGQGWITLFGITALLRRGWIAVSHQVRFYLEQKKTTVIRRQTLSHHRYISVPAHVSIIIVFVCVVRLCNRQKVHRSKCHYQYQPQKSNISQAVKGSLHYVFKRSPVSEVRFIMNLSSARSIQSTAPKPVSTKCLSSMDVPSTGYTGACRCIVFMSEDVHNQCSHGTQVMVWVVLTAHHVLFVLSPHSHPTALTVYHNISHREKSCQAAACSSCCVVSINTFHFVIKSSKFLS